MTLSLSLVSRSFFLVSSVLSLGLGLVFWSFPMVLSLGLVSIRVRSCLLVVLSLGRLVSWSSCLLVLSLDLASLGLVPWLFYLLVVLSLGRLVS